jgi:hypothetical protein
MKPKLQAAIILLIILLPTSANATAPKTCIPGVEKGDYFTYEMYGVFTSNRSNMTMVIPQFEYNNTEWVKISITHVDGSKIYQVYTLHFKNGSETEFDFETNVDPANQSTVFSGQSVPICAANRGVGDRIPTAELTINDTSSRAYPSGLRELNYVGWNGSDDWGNCCFDRETGMQVEFLRTHKFTNDASGEVILKTDVINLISTNRWEIYTPQSSPMLYFVVFVAGLIVLFFLTLLTYRFVIRKPRNRLTDTKTANYR